jgi:hypothetical protein
MSKRALVPSISLPAYGDVPVPIIGAYGDTLITIVAEWVGRIEPLLNNPPAAEWEHMKAAARGVLRRGNYARCEAMVETAEAGDPLVHDALIEEYRDLWHRRMEVPRLIDHYFVRFVDKPPKGKPGPKASAFAETAVTHLRRDIGVSVLLAVIYNRFGLHPTHNDGNANPCGSEVLSAAFKRRGIQLSAKRMRNIFAVWGQDTYAMVAHYVTLSTYISVI